MWDKASLHELIRTKLTDYQVIVVANREPYQHRYAGDDDERIECIRPASGMATALDPVMRASGGVWVAHGSGDADRATVDEHDHVQVPPEDPVVHAPTRLVDQGAGRRLLPRALQRGPLAALPHHVHPARLPSPALGDATARSMPCSAMPSSRRPATGPTFVFIQDYHFALLPRYLKERNPNLIIAQFWHIPWPNREVFRVFPWKEELLAGLLGNDLLGFHLRYHCQNFMDTVDRTLEARIDYEEAEIVHQNKSTLVRPVPDQHRLRAPRGDGRECRRRAGDAAMAAPDAAPRPAPGDRHRADRLHQGDSRADAGARSPVREVSRIPRAAELLPGGRPQPRAYPAIPGGRRRDRPPGRGHQLAMGHAPMAAGHLP